MKKKMSIRDLDFNNTGAWPREFKIGFCVLIAILIAAWVGRGLARPIVALQGAMRAITFTGRKETFASSQGIDSLKMLLSSA